MKFNLQTGEIDGVIKFENGAMVYIKGGNNIGRAGVLMSVEHHPGSYEIVRVKDVNNEVFATRLSNVFVIGEGKKSQITLPKHAGVRMTLLEERDRRIKQYERVESDADGEDDE